MAGLETCKPDPNLLQEIALVGHENVLCSTEDTGLQSLHAGDVEHQLLEEETPRSDDMRRASEVAAREPQLQGSNVLTVSPEHVADTRRRARFRSNGSEASFRGRARLSARFGGKDNDACSRFGQLSIAGPPTPTVHSDESPNDTADSVACPIIQTRVPRAGAPTLNAHSTEDSTNTDGWTDSQSSLAAAHAIELSLIEAAAATSELEVDHIAQTIHEADDHTLVIAKQLSQADAATQREADELNWQPCSHAQNRSGKANGKRSRPRQNRMHSSKPSQSRGAPQRPSTCLPSLTGLQRRLPSQAMQTQQPSSCSRRAWRRKMISSPHPTSRTKPTYESRKI